MLGSATGASSSSSPLPTSGGAAARRTDLATHRRQRLAQQNRRGLALSGAEALTSPLMSEQACKYKSGKCSNPRATKRNGQLHTLCSFHRMRQNEHQRKSDRKHRLINVSRRAKLGSFGLDDGGGHQSLHSILSLASSFPGGSPGMGMHGGAMDGLSGGLGHLGLGAQDQNTSDAFRNSQYAAATGTSPQSPGMSVGGLAAPLGGRLPPISYLTGKLDGYRASSAIPALSRRS